MPNIDDNLTLFDTEVTPFCSFLLLVAVCCCSLAADGSTEAAMVALQEQLHEKELRLTDVQLEALSSAHQLQQLQDTINRMKVTTGCSIG